MTKLFLDSNVAIYVLDPLDPAKQARSLAWLKAAASKNLLTISPQVCAEARNAAVKKLKMSVKDAHDAVLELLQWCTAPYGADEIRVAMQLEQRWRLSWWDSLLIASALGAGCTHFLTEDGQSTPVIEGLRFIDPFKTAPEDVLGAAV